MLSRPAVSEKFLSLTTGRADALPPKTPYRDGATHVMYELLDFIARLVVLVPKPQVNLTRYYGLFPPSCSDPCYCGLMAVIE
ncbi:MAG: transposase [Gammaproteobacteria bacterium]|nr:MAG: transposase [Gammaproteobacteria bacterium]